MWEFRNFVLGFSLSLVSVSLTSHLLASPSHTIKPYTRNTNVSIELYKKNDTINKEISFSNIQKSSLPISHSQSETDVSYLASDAAETKLADLSLSQDTVQNSDIIYSPQEINGSEDDEILSINIDNTIPIDIENSHDISYNTEITYGDDNDNKIALLPADVSSDTLDSSFDSPWVIAQGSKHIKNKKLLEKYAPDTSNKLAQDNFTPSVSDDNTLSYKVAERIKQSIIFPIPDEILNDENLTPTFIFPQKKAPAKQEASTDKKNTSSVAPAKEAQPLKIISKTTPTHQSSSQKQEASKGILDNISSWFSPASEEKEAPQKTTKSKAAPLYSSQDNQKSKPSTSTLSSNDALVSFYETIQETQKEQAANKIIPSELKLSFQPDRAEISGQTLRWLKAFSEKTKEKGHYLQIRLDATAPIELQRKRLNLLYTIFMNNGVDFKKVDTVFSLTEPNTFIIRTIKIQE